MRNVFNCIDTFKINDLNDKGTFFSLPLLKKNGMASISKLPVSLRIILESMIRNYDGIKIKESHVHSLANWKPNEVRTSEIPFVVSRIVLQDYTGVPLLADLAAMRNIVKKMRVAPETIEPLVPVSLVVDHSLHTNVTGSKDAVDKNLDLEFSRNQERYEFMKWGSTAFNRLQIIPPGLGIVHQVNLEYLSKGVFVDENCIYYPDTVVGTDSHTTMVNGIGIVGWGVGGIEAEAGMLGQPIYFQMPDVVGVHLTGQLREGVNTTDLVLTLTEILRKAKVVGKIVEYFGEGVKLLTAQERATIANMAPDYGATMGFFPIDEQTLTFYERTGREKEQVQLIRNYFEAQELFGVPQIGDCDYSQIIEVDLTQIETSIAGPKRPQDRINLSELKTTFEKLLVESSDSGGYDLPNERVNAKVIIPNYDSDLAHGDILIAGITSCTNTSNPSVLVAAGILAKKAYLRGLKIKKSIKTSLTPGSRVVETYLKNAGLFEFLEKIGFYIAGYGCATCVGNVGNLDPILESSVKNEKMIVSAVLSGNRNFEARIHPNIRSNFLMSPALVIAFVLAGTVRIDLSKEPLGLDIHNKPVYLKDIWPSQEEVDEAIEFSRDSKIYKDFYSNINKRSEAWEKISYKKSRVYKWNKNSTYIAEPPFFKDFSLDILKSNNILSARALLILGDSITTDHISPAGSIDFNSVAGTYLKALGVNPNDFNSFGARRGNHEVMVRGTFSNSQIKNKIVPDLEGGYTFCTVNKEIMSIYDAAILYESHKIPTIIFAGEEYGTGSSRDWAAKGTKLLGVKAVIAKSFERIHRSNLIGMGVLPCQFQNNDDVNALAIKGDQIFDIIGLDQIGNKEVTLVIKSADGVILNKTPLTVRLDNEIEVEYHRHGGILPYVLRESLKFSSSNLEKIALTNMI